ncbi:unnamed protein product [Camellia sinensis]
MEINSDVKREEVERMVRELMAGERGKEMKRKVMEWKKLGEEATTCSIGSSYLNFEKMVRVKVIAHMDKTVGQVVNVDIHWDIKN